MQMTGFIQQSLSLSRHFILFGAVLAAWPFLRERPSYRGLAPASVAVPIDPVAQPAPAGWTLHGAWSLGAPDPRLVGLSGLTCGEGRLAIVTDVGAEVLMDFPVPGADTAHADVRTVRGLFDGEARAVVGEDVYLVDESGEKLWRARPGGKRQRIRLPRHPGSVNKGVEAVLEPAPGERGLLLFREGGRRGWRLEDPDEPVFAPVRVLGAPMRITGAARHPDGRGFILMRAVGAGGFSAALAQVAVDGEEVRVGPTLRLPLPRNANAEGLCIEPRGADSARLWIVTDDNGLDLLVQRLVAWDVPFDAWPAAPGDADRD